MSTRRAAVVERSRPRGRAAGARRRQVVRRRRALGFLAGLVVLATGAAIAIPMLDDAVREIRLPLRHEDIIRQQARDKDLDPAMIAAVIYAESKFRDQTSPTGAKGLMQIQPQTAHYIAAKSGGTAFELRDLGTPQINIQYGSWYLRYLMQRYDGNEVPVLAAYNAGEGNVDRWISRSGRGAEAFRVSDIRFAETRHYVTRVLDAQRDYRGTYRAELGL
jgi:soluble lytic murein transglycosylase